MAAMNKWTIPTDPGFQTRRSDNATVGEMDQRRPKPRIKPEAMMIAIKNQGTVGQLFNPYAKQPSFRSSSRSGSRESKRDFIKENAKQIKTIQKVLGEREAGLTAREPLKVLHKSEKYEHVESKVAQEVKGTPHAPRAASTSHIRRHSCSDYPGQDRPSSVKSAAAPKDKSSSTELGPLISKEKAKQTKVNHISKNIHQLRSSPGQRRRSPSAVASEKLERKRFEEEKKYKRGEVPDYLRKRQEQWKTEEEERIKNTPDPRIPPGHTLMPRDERLQTLELLKKRQKEMTTALNSLPVSCDTLRIKQRKIELENKLKEIENALKIFSRPKVFVKIDS